MAELSQHVTSRFKCKRHDKAHHDFKNQKRKGGKNEKEEARIHDEMLILETLIIMLVLHQAHEGRNFP